MILRRFMQHVREQNWFAVGLDVIVVIVGIFLGMQVQGWYEHRKERELEVSYYQQLIQDLKIDQENGEAVVRANDYYYDNVIYLYDALKNPNFTIEDPQKLAIAIIIAGFLYVPQTTDQTYKELTNTGYLRLIKDVELKRAVVTYYERLESSSQWNSIAREIQTMYKTHTAGLLPPDILRKYRLAEEYEFSEMDALKVLQIARQRTELIEILSHMADQQTRTRIAGQRLISTAKELEKLIIEKIEITK